jgi:hypothetical protein
MPVLLTALAFSLWFLRNALSEAVNGFLVALALAWSAVFAFTFGFCWLYSWLVIQLP